MPHERIPIAVIGSGRIGAQVIEGLRALPVYRLIGIVGRDGGDLPPARITIDTAGPDALREHALQALVHGDLWTVGAAALIDPTLRDTLELRAVQNGHRIRLFTAWISGPALCPPDLSARLYIRQSAPLLARKPGVIFRGPLAEAATRFPDHLNTATAAAIDGPGIEATHVTMISSPKGGVHRIAARFTMPGQTIRTDVRFDKPGPQPVASAILAALAQRTRSISLG